MKKEKTRVWGFVRLTKGELFPRVRRESESKDSHRCNEEARHNQVEEVVECSPPDPHLGDYHE